jgi:hypothetical protein
MSVMSTGPVRDQWKPKLYLNPGDQLLLTLTNNLIYLPPPPPAPKGVKHLAGMAGMSQRTTPDDPCSGGTMVATSTNIHFHGLNIPPICHQDEVVQTDIENTDLPFQYNFQSPAMTRRECTRIIPPARILYTASQRRGSRRLDYQWN